MSLMESITDHGLLNLNQNCQCFPIARKDLDQHIIVSSAHAGMPELLAARENYFASTAVFLSQTDLSAMAAQIKAIENTIKTRGYQSAVYARGYNGAYDVQTDTQGVFMGYDFHMTTEGPRLIEINSNAGGAFIVNALEQAISKTGMETEDKIAHMFTAEWLRAGRKGKPQTIAIIDEAPEDQFHFPDMLLASSLLARQGFEVIITDPRALRYAGGKLYHGETVIDLVYNRLTDFSLTGPNSASLSQALAEDAVVITPNPRHHALFADKRNLALLSEQAQRDRDPNLSQIPATLIVIPENQEQLWRDRKQYFFKPYGGFGSRGVYKGAKLTTKVWAQITQGGYIAQKFIPAPVRAVTRNDDKSELKFDLRAYSYDGEIMLLAARVYQGQTTNLRTEGGGLAPVIMLKSTSHCLPG